ncbi:radical SAM protein, partial [bacterium]|nr:radical SAM protein [bacterium]
GIMQQAEQMGVSIILIAGGEPLLRPGFLKITKRFPEIIFPVFTNGMLLNEELLRELGKQKNLIPTLSLEGRESATDQRRGPGVYAHLQNLMKKLRNRKIFWGVSLTATSANFEEITQDQFVQELMIAGCRLIFLVEYVPIKSGTEDLVLTTEQRSRIGNIIDTHNAKFPGVFIALPGDESGFGGCLSAGRGFIHVNPEGKLEPCPFAPFSDVSLQKMDLKEALQSRFLKTIRENHEKMSETQGGCALWAERDWVRALLDSSQEKADEK